MIDYSKYKAVLVEKDNRVATVLFIMDWPPPPSSAAAKSWIRLTGLTWSALFASLPSHSRHQRRSGSTNRNRQ
jgi:hypothetical protein